jgi:hypothetical protein
VNPQGHCKVVRRGLDLRRCAGRAVGAGFNFRWKGGPVERHVRPCKGFLQQDAGRDPVAEGAQVVRDLHRYDFAMALR